MVEGRVVGHVSRQPLVQEDRLALQLDEMRRDMKGRCR